MLRNIVFVTSEVSLVGKGLQIVLQQGGLASGGEPVHGGEAVHTVKGHSLP